MSRLLRIRHNYDLAVYMIRKILLFSLFALLPVITFATSGACSGHGGVSCGAGSDSDGSVICNDGWRNSSVSYSSMVMCGAPSKARNIVAPIKSEPKPIVQPVAKPTVKPVVQETPIPKVDQLQVVKPEVPKPVQNVTTTTKVIPVPQVTSPKPIKSIQTEEVKKTPIEETNTVVQPNTEVNIPSKNIEQKIVVKKKGFFSRLFSLFHFH